MRMVSKQITAYMRSLGRKGGTARKAVLTANERSAIARKGAIAMHAKRVLHNASK